MKQAPVYIFVKVLKMINSCTEPIQLKTANRVIDLYAKLYTWLPDISRLHNALQLKRIDVEYLNFQTATN